MANLIPFIFCMAVFVAFAAVAVLRHSYVKSRRQVRPPIDLKLLRLPGESLRLKSEKLFESAMDWLVFGSMASIGLLITPVSLLMHFYPKADLIATVLSGLALFLAGSVAVVSRVIALIRERGDVRLGHAGERAVAEELQPLMKLGYRVYHDVPIMRNGVTSENIDHVAVGPHGLVVIETKTRSLSTKPNAGTQQVTFNGKCLSWPTWGNDFKTVVQVKRCADWVKQLVKTECGLEVEVQQVIAIPGWTVLPGKEYNPRVVSGSGVADAVTFILKGKPTPLKPKDIDKICQKLNELCRDVEW